MISKAIKGGTSLRIESLKSFFAEGKRSVEDNVATITKSIKSCMEGKDKKKLPIFVNATLQHERPEVLPDLVVFLQQSNLLTMGEDLKLKEDLTFGADPEFILQPLGKPDEVALFSSEHGVPYGRRFGEFKMSSVAIGADYGLLEMRPAPADSVKELIANIKSLHKAFAEAQKSIEEDVREAEEEGKSVELEPLEIKRTEAVQFNHKIERIRRRLENDDLDFGENVFVRAKDSSVMAAGEADIGLAGTLLEGVNLTAYDRPIFAGQTDDMLTAGGHIHFGGFLIKMLSLEQLKALVRKFDEALIPIATKVETSAADLRREQYGLPGEFRLKEHGFEYRVLSCAPFWPDNSKVLNEILDSAEKIIRSLKF